MREDYTTDAVCGTSSESPLRITQESASGVESIREYTGTTYRMEQAALWCSPEIGGRVEGVSSYFCLFLNTYAASTLS